MIWTWVGAKSTGTSHLKAGTHCDDFGSCVEVSSKLANVLVIAVSDGAGSAQYSAIGARITSRVFVKNATRFIKGVAPLRDLSTDIVKEWIDEIRDTITSAALKHEATPRDFAATLVGCLIGDDFAIFCHVGDGAAVYRTEADNDWIVSSWPAQGEYASTTYFVTDSPEARSRFVVVDQKINEVAVFTDGIEQLVLEFSNRSAYTPFFDRMFHPINGTFGGRNRKLSRDLASFLDGPLVCEKTDDDKTLILAKRIQ
jgi:hypothetical protein